MGDTIGNSVIEQALSPAVAAWNSKLPEVGKGLRICSGPSCNDNFTVMIKTVDNMNNSTSPRTDNPDEGCGTSRACVKPDGNGSSSDGPGRHMENMYIVFENPPWGARLDLNGDWKRTEYVWTDVRDKHGEDVPCFEAAAICNMMDTRVYVYVGRVMLHEFGHTLGLPDFYDDRTGLRDLEGVMKGSFEIQDEDIEQLKAIYLLHSRH